MRFEVMGPLLVVGDDGRPVRLPRGKVRQLLAALLVAGRPVPEHKLCEWLSGDGRVLGGSTVRTHVAALRRALGPAADRMRTEPSGYLIDVRVNELDLRLFRSEAERGCTALAAGDCESAVRLLRKAAALWREPVLADLPDTPHLLPEVIKLTEEWHLVNEALVDARLGLGEDRVLIPELRARCAMDSLRERAFEQLMVALYRSGRRAEACDIYLELCKRLAESYGADPGPAVVELYHLILNDDRSLFHLSSRRSG